MHGETDQAFLIRRYKGSNGGREPSLERPTLFSEKVIQRMLNDRNPLFRTFCDKLACRAWIDEQLGKGFTPETLATGSSLEDLLSTPLPPRWFLKANHGSGWFRLVDDQSQPIDDDARGEAESWLSRDYYDVNREWAYRDLPRRLIAEAVIDNSGQQAIEFQFFFFHGKHALIRLYRDNRTKLPRKLRANSEFKSNTCYMDSRLRLLPILKQDKIYNYDSSLADYAKPHIGHCLEAATQLAAGLDFLRVDGFISSDGVRFNELTPYPGAGFELKLPREWDAWIGSFWT